MEYLREENALALRMLSRTHAVSAGPAESRREEKKKKEKKAKVQPPAASKLRILALHGYEQDSEILRHKSGALRSHVKAVAEFEFLDAPHAVPDSPEGRAWFLFGGFEAGQSTFEGLEESFSAIDRIFETSGPFDGIFGFSQGAALAAALCIITEARRRLTAEAKATGVLSERATAFLDLTKHCDFRFALLVSGFIPSGARHFSSLHAPLFPGWKCALSLAQFISPSLSVSVPLGASHRRTVARCGCRSGVNRALGR